MNNKTNWQQFFDGHAPVYMTNCFTTNTLADVDFLIQEMGRHRRKLGQKGRWTWTSSR